MAAHTAARAIKVFCQAFFQKSVVPLVPLTAAQPPLKRSKGCAIIKGLRILPCKKGTAATMRNEFLEIGKIVAIHALRGEMRVQPWCDSPDFFTSFDRFYLAGEAVGVEAARPHKNVVLLKLAGIDTPEAAQKLVGQILSIRRDQAQLPAGTYFVADLIGLSVTDADDPSVVYGVLCEVSETGANDVYHIRFPDGQVKLIPAIPQVVVSTDLDAGVMAIRPLEGLFDAN
jgi:16S rRNA processing protein RimM